MVRIDLKVNISATNAEPWNTEVLVHFTDAASVFGMHCEHLVEEGEEFG